MVINIFLNLINVQRAAVTATKSCSAPPLSAPLRGRRAVTRGPCTHTRINTRKGRRKKKTGKRSYCRLMPKTKLRRNNCNRLEIVFIFLQILCPSRGNKTFHYISYLFLITYSVTSKTHQYCSSAILLILD